MQHQIVQQEEQLNARKAELAELAAKYTTEIDALQTQLTTARANEVVVENKLNLILKETEKENYILNNKITELSELLEATSLDNTKLKNDITLCVKEMDLRIEETNAITIQVNEKSKELEMAQKEIERLKELEENVNSSLTDHKAKLGTHCHSPTYSLT